MDIYNRLNGVIGTHQSTRYVPLGYIGARVSENINNASAAEVRRIVKRVKSPITIGLGDSMLKLKLVCCSDGNWDKEGCLHIYGGDFLNGLTQVTLSEAKSLSFDVEVIGEYSLMQRKMEKYEIVNLIANNRYEMYIEPTNTSVRLYEYLIQNTIPFTISDGLEIEVTNIEHLDSITKMLYNEGISYMLMDSLNDVCHRTVHTFTNEYNVKNVTCDIRNGIPTCMDIVVFNNSEVDVDMLVDSISGVVSEVYYDDSFTKNKNPVFRKVYEDRIRVYDNFEDAIVICKLFQGLKFSVELHVGINGPQNEYGSQFIAKMCDKFDSTV